MHRREHLNCLIHVKITGLGISLVASLILTAYASADQPTPDNWREKCRQIISGQYLQIYDSRHQLEQQSLMLVSQITKMAKDLANTRTRYDALETKTRHDDFDKDRALELQNLRSKLRLQESLLADKNSALTNSREKLNDASAKLGRFTTKIEGIFRIDQKKPEESDPGYGLRLEFRSPCPKHRHVCPLSTEEAKILRELSSELEGTEACLKYSQIKS